MSVKVVRQVEETEQEERARLRLLEAKLRAENKEKVGATAAADHGPRACPEC